MNKEKTAIIQSAGLILEANGIKTKKKKKASTGSYKLLTAEWFTKCEKGINMSMIVFHNYGKVKSLDHEWILKYKKIWMYERLIQCLN